MDKTTLVEKDFESGEILIKALLESGFDLQAAFWFYFDESDLWRLVIASKLYSEKGPKEVYSQIRAEIDKLTPPVDIALTNISAISHEKEIVVALNQVLGMTKDVWGVRLGNQVISGLYIDGARLYFVNENQLTGHYKTVGIQ